MKKITIYKFRKINISISYNNNFSKKYMFGSVCCPREDSYLILIIKIIPFMRLVPPAKKLSSAFRFLRQIAL